MPESVLKPGTTIYDYALGTSDFSLREARAEYSRLRKIASKRLARMEKSAYGSSDIFRRYAGRFAPLPRGASEERVRKMLYEVARFTERKTGSISGMKASRRAQVEAMQEQGYDWINEGNINAFNDYMERIKKFVAAHQLDSDRAVEMFREAEEASLDPMEVAEDFEDYLAGIKTIPEPPEPDEDEDEALEEIRRQPAVKKPKEPRKKAEPKAKEVKRKKGKK